MKTPTSLSTKQAQMLAYNRGKAAARKAAAAARRLAKLSELRQQTAAERRAARQAAKAVEAVYVLFDFQNERIYHRRKMSLEESQRRNFAGWARRNIRRWVLETEVPVSDEDPKMVDAALWLIERQNVQEPRSFAPSSMGSASYRQHALYHVFERDKPFHEMEELL